MIQLSPSFRVSRVIDVVKKLAETCSGLGCQEIANGLNKFTDHARQDPEKVLQLRGAANTLFSLSIALKKITDPIEIFNRAIPNAEMDLVEKLKIDLKQSRAHSKYPRTHISFDANPWVNKVSAEDFLAVDATQYPNALPILYQAYLYTKYALDDHAFVTGASAPQLKPTITHRSLDRERFAFAFTSYLQTILERANDSDRAKEIEALFHVTGINTEEVNSNELIHAPSQSYFQKNFNQAREGFIEALRTNNPDSIKESLETIEKVIGLANRSKNEMTFLKEKINDETFLDLSIDFKGLYRFLLLEPLKQFIDLELTDNHKAKELAKQFALVA